MRETLLAATLLAAASVAAPLPTHAQGYPSLTPEEAAAQVRRMTDPAASPVTGAAIFPGVTPINRPPSLEALMAARPGVNPEAGIPEARAAILRDAGTTYGAAGGLAARGYAINEMLRRHEPELDRVYDFRRVVVPLGRGDTLLMPPVVSEAQMAMALEQGGQRARTTGRIYRITREAEIVSEPPNWRALLVQTWPHPEPPLDQARPKNRDEVKYWEQVVAEGWALGETQAVQVFLAKLAALESTLVGAARYKVLLSAGLVEQPTVAMQFRRVQGGGGVLRLDDTDIEIRRQGGLQADPRRWRGTAPVAPGGPIGQPPAR